MPDRSSPATTSQRVISRVISSSAPMPPETATWHPPFRRNFGGPVLGCINTDFCDQILILQHFSRTTIFSNFCTFFFRSGKTLENPPQGPAKCSCICGQGCRTKPGLQKNELLVRKTNDNEKRAALRKREYQNGASIQ